MVDLNKTGYEELDGEFETGEKRKGIKLPKGGGMMQWIITVVLILAVSYVMISYFGVTKEDFNKNIALMLNADDSVKADVTAIKSSITAEINKIPGAITTQVNSAISSLSARLTALENGDNNFGSQISSLNTQLTNSLSSTNGIINELTQTITDLENAIKAQETTINGLKVKITTLETEVSDLGTGSGDTTTPTGEVGAYIVGNAFTGLTAMTFEPIAAGASTSMTFTFQIDNQTGKKLDTISMALALQTFNADGTYRTLTAGTTGVNVSVTSDILSLKWISQTTGIPYLLGFMSSINTSGFTSMFGDFIVNPGLNTYTMTVTIENKTSATIDEIIVAPLIQVVSFTTE